MTPTPDPSAALGTGEGTGERAADVRFWADALAVAEVELDAKERRLVTVTQECGELRETIKGLRRFLMVGDAL